MESNKYKKNRVALFVCYDLIGLFFLNDLIPKLIAYGWEPIIFNTGSKRNRKVRVQPPHDVSFYGAGIVGNALIPFLDSHETLKDELGNPIKNLCYSFKQIAELYHLDYYDIQDVNAQDLRDLINHDDRFIGGISIRFLQLFDQDIVDLILKKGFFLNLHGGILPNYKGLLIPYRAIYRGDKEYGWTLHQMAKDIDAGDIITICKQPLDLSKPVFEIYMDMIPDGVNIVIKTLEYFQKTGTYVRISQGNWDRSTYYAYPTSEEMKIYSDMGIRFIDSPLHHVERIVLRFCGESIEYSYQLRNELITSIRMWQSDTQSPQGVGVMLQDRAA